jgi:uncharacterized protein YegJ (DUF2314 family)
MFRVRIKPHVLRSQIVLALLAFMWVGGCGKKKPDTLVEDGYDQEEMEAAISRARSELPRFLEAFTSKAGADFSVKVPIRDGEDTEHFWMIDIRLDGNEFVGKIGNEPGTVTTVKFGQEYRIKKDEISDWMYMRDGKMYGNYTMRPLLRTMPKEEADYYRAMFAEP